MVHKAALDQVAPRESKETLGKPELVGGKEFKAALGRQDLKELKEFRVSKVV